MDDYIHENCSKRRNSTQNLRLVYICILSPYNLPKDLFFPLIIPLDHDHDGIAGFEIGVLVVERVPAHDDRAVGEVAEHTAGVFARDACPAAAADGVAQAGFVEGVRNGLLDGDIQAAGLVVKLFDHAGQLIARMILLPQVGDGGVTHIALREIDVIAVTLDQTPARADGQYMARHAAARLVERLRGEEIASGRQRQTARADGETVPAAKYGL